MAIGINMVLFLTPQTLKDNTVINNNVEDKILRKCISSAEDKYIHPLVGSGLYSAITGHISALMLSGTPIPATYKTLLDDYIVPTLIEYSTYELIPFSYKIFNKGISRQSSPDSIPAEVDELIYLRNNILNQAQFYGTRLTSYLRTNSNLYPEYYTVMAGDIQPAKGAYSSAILIPGRNRSGYGDCCGPYGYGFGINVNL